MLTFAYSSLFQFTVGLDGKKVEPESNVLLASIENMQYAVTLDVLHTVLAIVTIILENLIWACHFQYFLINFSLPLW